MPFPDGTPTWWFERMDAVDPMLVALCEVWREPAIRHAQKYIQELTTSLRLRSAHPWHRGTKYQSRAVGPFAFGPYLVDEFLGVGAFGKAYAATDTRTGNLVTLKMPAGAEALVAKYLGADMPAEFLRVFEAGDGYSPAGEPLEWVARERADETYADVLAARRGSPLPIADVLPVFLAACKGVAGLHDRGVYHWSSHARNVFRVGSVWKMGDLRRVVIALPPGDARIANQDQTQTGQRADDPFAEPGAGPWQTFGSTGYFAADVDRERRLRMNDCAMLAGLLCDLLSADRWAMYTRALSKQPYCCAHYPITNDRATDTQLSEVLNRAWRGDGGAAVLLANDGRGAQTTYDNPLELLADTQLALA